MKKSREEVPGSFRDPSGFLFLKEGILYRQVNSYYRDDYDHLMVSGLYSRLTGSGLLIPHNEMPPSYAEKEGAYKVLKPEPVAFVSYPYEWCFSQLKDAALATLQIQKIAVEYGMTLKDASAYNIQFHHSRPLLIDTLSFEKLGQVKPWVAYRQFCQHFLAPLLLMAYRDHRCGRMLRLNIDGIPLDLCSKLLPRFTRFVPGISMHIHMHALSQRRYAARRIDTGDRKIGKTALLGIIDSLESLIKKAKIRIKKSEWGEYYADTNYSPRGFDQKQKILKIFLDKTAPAVVWDLGANTGIFSRIAAESGCLTISFDMDMIAVELSYRENLLEKQTRVLPLLLDFANPSPAIGWENKERLSFMDRGPVDTVIALALIHHLAISNNLPLEKTAIFFHRLCRYLIIEFVPKSDSQVQRLLVTRKDIFHHYTTSDFENEFSWYFDILESEGIPDSQRIIYLMRAKNTKDS